MSVFLWLISLSIMPSWFIHVVMTVRISSFFMTKCFIVYICIYIYTHVFFIHSCTGTLIVCMSWLLWIMLQWTRGCRYFFQVVIKFSLAICPEVGFLDPMVVLFLIFWRKPYAILHSACFKLHSHQQCTRVPFPLISLPTLVLSFW